jgi:predicted anti-sigma-YlaC factor YlaD
MTCHALDELLDDWVDGALAGAEAREVASHLAGCVACRERERQLRQLLAHAAALPRSVAPARDLWPGIAERIERGSFWSTLVTSWQPLALAAAAVVLGLSALIWNGAGPAAVRTVAMPSASPTLRSVAGTGVGDPVLAAAARDYEEAASTLLEALQRRRAALPAEDLARVEANLEVIDRALEEVRQALVKDPASPELNRMLVATHRKKVDVLRRVVRLSTAL